jgi:hypothetical protein
MSSMSRWRDSGHPERAVETAGGQEAFDAAVAAMLDDARPQWIVAASANIAHQLRKQPVATISKCLGYVARLRMAAMSSTVSRAITFSCGRGAGDWCRLLAI